MFCPKCGTKIEEGAKFCPVCGTRVAEAAGMAAGAPAQAGAAMRKKAPQMRPAQAPARQEAVQGAVRQTVPLEGAAQVQAGRTAEGAGPVRRTAAPAAQAKAAGDENDRYLTILNILLAVLILLVGTFVFLYLQGIL